MAPSWPCDDDALTPARTLASRMMSKPLELGLDTSGTGSGW